MSDQYYPPPAFYFNLTVIGSATALFAMTMIDASCQEVTGIQAEFEFETVVEGGENRFVHRLPRYTKFPNLVLKRGIVTKTSNSPRVMLKVSVPGGWFLRCHLSMSSRA